MVTSSFSITSLTTTTRFREAFQSRPTPPTTLKLTLFSSSQPPLKTPYQSLERSSHHNRLLAHMDVLTTKMREIMMLTIKLLHTTLGVTIRQVASRLKTGECSIRICKRDTITIITMPTIIAAVLSLKVSMLLFSKL
jgi:hypothetical protein